MSSIPTGFRFEPTDEELLRGFLYPKLVGHPLPWDGITDRDVYGDNAEPWIVFSDADDDGYSPYWNIKKEGGAIKKTIYVFTSVTKAASNSKRISRRAGCGTWSGQTGPKNIYHSDTGEIIGTTRMLSFQSNKKHDCAANKDLVGHWIMHEYSLSDAALEMSTAAQTNTHLVVCKITKCLKKESQHRALIQQEAAAAATQQQFYFPLEGNVGSSDHNDTRIPVTAAAQQQFYFPLEGDGGSDHINDIGIPAMAAGNVNKRAAGEELEQEGCKKQKYSSSSIGDEGFLDVDLEGCDLGDIDLDSIEGLINFDFSSTSLDFDL